MAKYKSLFEAISDELRLHQQFVDAVRELVTAEGEPTVSSVQLAYMIGLLEGAIKKI
jgi:hypothetical protein